MLALSGREDHRQRVDALVQRWLAERQSLIVQMIELGGGSSPGATAPSLPERVQAFCEILMDYVSAGHFEVYDELLAEVEKQGSERLADSQALLQRLQPTTDAVIRFNDIYDDPNDADALANLAHELSLLGLALESRFEIEDRMIALLDEGEDQSAA
ncbi:MAG: rsd [Moraxellaceae bacterium]|jgi:regulator of sigma D|nr:rsd [Moraxellaceae bacterium]